MKNIFFICFCALFAFSGCADDDDDLLTGGNVDIDLLPDAKPNDVVDPQVFEAINLNYPGLEKVKEFYEAGEHYYAANALLEYYRTRTNVTNPNLSLINVTISEAEQAKADYALVDYRFHVNNFYEDKETLKPYSVKQDGGINWEYSPKDASDEYQKQLHRHQWFIPQAKAYRVSGDEKYIQSWIEVYKNWIENNPKPTTGPNTTSWWQLQVSTRIGDQVQLLEYFKNSVNFTPEWLSTFLVEFAEQADFLVDYPYESGGNILISQANALATAGTLMPEFKNAEKWMNTGYQILSEEVQNQIMSDGWHKEMSLHYHIGIVADFYEAMKLAEANQLSSKLPSDFTEPLRKAAEVVMYFTYPNYFIKGSDNVVPMFNDSWSRTRNVLKNTNFKQYVEMFPDSEELKYMQTAGNGGTAQGRTPNNDMKLFDQAGYYVLRNGWTPASTVMILSNNKSNDASNSLSAYSHNQPDNGTFELYINERNFFPDSGVCAYESSDKTIQGYRNWHRKTMHHNTLTLDDRNCEKADGKLLQSETKGNVETLVFENQSYPNMRHRRAVFYVNKEFFVLVDEGIGSAAGSANLSFNLCRYESEVEYDANEMGAHTTFTDNNIVVRTFTNETATFNEMEGRVAYVVKNDVFDKRKAYQIKINKLANKTARFITVIYPCKKTEGQTIEAVFTDNGYSANGASIKVTINGIEYPLSYILQSNNF